MDILQKIRTFLGFSPSSSTQGISSKGMLVFSHTGEVIRAEQVLLDAGFCVEVKGPPPELRTGCDMIVLFPLLEEVAILQTLAQAGLTPDQTAPVQDTLLEPVSLFHCVDFDKWFMVRAANMKITADKESGRIVNISGGGCPDVPYLANLLTGLDVRTAPEPRTLGHTLCCYSLQKAFEELRRHLPKAIP